MSVCHYIESYIDREGARVSVFQRGNYLYELAKQVRHVRWFNDMSLDQVREWLNDNGYVIDNRLEHEA